MIKCWRQWSNKSCHSDLATEFTWDKQKYPTNFKVVGTFMLSHLRPARLLLTLSLELAPNYCYTRSSHIPDFSCPCDNLVLRPWYWRGGGIAWLLVPDRLPSSPLLCTCSCFSVLSFLPSPMLGRQLPDDNRNMMISRSSGRSGFIYMVNV